MLHPFRLITPTSLAEAATEIGLLGDAARIYAGGAELLLLMRHRLVRAEYLVDVKRIPELTGIASEDGVVRIGAAVTHRELERSPLIREQLPVLWEAESRVGNIRVRTQGTLGGNLCFADPHSDPPTALLVHDAVARVASARGERQMPLEEFLLGTFETALEPDELLVSIEVPVLPPEWKGMFCRIERFYRPTTNAAAAAKVEEGRVREVRLAVGCIGPKATRLPELEASLQGLAAGDAVRAVRESKAYLAERLEPVDDLLGSADYKVHVTAVLLAHALDQLCVGDKGAPIG